MLLLKSITSANSIFTISALGAFPTPVPIQGYSMDRAFSNDAVQATEVTMGIDGFMSAGFVFKETKQKITLSADSPSRYVFDTIFAAMHSTREVIFLNAWLVLPSVMESYTFFRGVLSSYPGAPAATKKLEPVEYELTWQSVTKAPI